MELSKGVVMLEVTFDGSLDGICIQTSTMDITSTLLIFNQDQNISKDAFCGGSWFEQYYKGSIINEQI